MSKLKLSLLLVIGLGVLLSVSGCFLFNQPPQARFTWYPKDPTVGQTVNFVDQSQDPDGLVSSWAWDFGDGTTSSQQNPTHKYNSAGTYSVTLSVKDNSQATASYSASITVSGGGGGGCDPAPQVSVWVDKQVYSLGETIHLHFSLNKSLTVSAVEQFANDGWQTVFGSQLYNAGTYEYAAKAGITTGYRTIYLTGTDACGHSATASVTFQVGSGVFVGSPSNK